MTDPADFLATGLALFTPPLVSLWRDPSPRREMLVAQLLLWGLTLGLVAYALGPRGIDPVALGLVGPSWRTALTAAVLVATILFVTAPLAMRLLVALGGSFTTGKSRLRDLPAVWIVAAILSGAVLEEILYRSLPTALLAPAGLSYPAIFLILAAGFTLAHVPMWGWRAALSIGIASTPLTIGYLLTGDLIATSLAHAAVDLLGLAPRRPGKP